MHIFAQYPIEYYKNWETDALFGLYISMQQEHSNLPDDMNEMRKVEHILMRQTLPEKYKFFNSIANYSLKELYFNSFVCIPGNSD